MPTNVIYPKVSLEMSAGKVSHWLVSEGETVRSGQILFEIENDKAAVEVEAPADGVIRDLVDVETEVDVGSPVALIYAPGESAAPTSAAPRDASAGPVLAPASPIQVSPAQVSAAQVSPAHVSAAQAPASPAPRARGPLPTPLARRIARDENISLEGLAGTGPRGRVQKKDVMARLEALAQPPIAVAATPSAGEGQDLHHVWLRRGKGIPLVLLHGFSSDLNTWRGLLAGSRFGRPVLAVDLPGHGNSPLGIPADIDAMAAAVERTLVGLTDGPMVLAGHSFGAALATRIAAGGGLDLRGLCLFAPAGLGPEINFAFIDGVLRAREAASLRPWLNELVHDSAVISDTFLRAVVEQRRNLPLTQAMRAFADRFFPDGTQSVSILADLDRIRVPTRVIFGRNDRILRFARTRALAGHVALHALEGCGHMPHLERPVLALRILSELLLSAEGIAPD